MTGDLHDVPAPSPLVAAEVDLRDFSDMMLDVRKLRDSRFGAEVSGDAFRAGVMLWCAAWHQVPCGSVPDDDIELANLAGYGRFVKEWKKSREQALQGFVKCSDGRLYHLTVSEKANAAWIKRLEHYYERARDRLRKANKDRTTKGLSLIPEITFDAWNAQRLSGGTPMEKADASAGTPGISPTPKPGIPAENALKGTERERRGNGEGEGEGDLLIGAEGSADGPAPPASPPVPAAAASAARGQRLTADWRLPKAWGDWALEAYPQWGPDKVRLEGEKFRDHWVAKTGKDATKVDWLATWRNWCRSPIAHQDDPKSAAPASAQRSAKNAAARARIFGAAGAAPAPNPTEVIDG